MESSKDENFKLQVTIQNLQGKINFQANHAEELELNYKSVLDENKEFRRKLQEFKRKETRS